MIRKYVIGGALILLMILVGLFYRSCVPHKLNQAVFYTDDDIELKVVRYLENMPFHYYGPKHAVGCRSDNTQPQHWQTIQDRGWTEIPISKGMYNIGWDPSLSVLVDAAERNYLVIEKNTMIMIREWEILVTWDGCGPFTSWGVNSIPDEDVKQDGYLACLRDHPKLLSTCKPENFRAENAPVFRDLNAKASGYASFKVSSKAFLATESYEVETRDSGKTWSLHPI